MQGLLAGFLSGAWFVVPLALNSFLLFPTPYALIIDRSHDHPAGLSPDLFGIALSGGGVPAMLSGFCCIKSLFSHLPSMKDSTIISTTSGGTLGYMVYNNDVGEKLKAPRYDPTRSLADLSSSVPEDNNGIWFARVNSIVPPGAQPEGNDALSTILDGASNYAKVFPRKNWWSQAIQLLDHMVYNLDDIGSGDRQWYAATTLIAASALPIELDNATGVYAKANETMFFSVIDMSTQIPAISGALAQPGLHMKTGTRLSDSVSHSAFFWGNTMIHNGSDYRAHKGTLNKDYLMLQQRHPNSAGAEGLLAAYVDGGTVDPTAITALLQHKTGRILMMYNVNTFLTSNDAGLAWLFGRDPSATKNVSHLVLHGPVLGKVFANGDVYDEVYANLTDPSIMMARLQNVEVQKNPYLGVEAYTLKELMILSNEFSKEFTESFIDKSIPAHLSANFPTNYGMTMTDLEANTMCMFEDWKVQRHLQAIREVSGADRQDLR